MSSNGRVKIFLYFLNDELEFSNVATICVIKQFFHTWNLYQCIAKLLRTYVHVLLAFLTHGDFLKKKIMTLHKN